MKTDILKTNLAILGGLMLPFQISNYISGLNYNYNFIYIEHYIEYIYPEINFLSTYFNNYT